MSTEKWVQGNMKTSKASGESEKTDTKASKKIETE
jgi:hypothetical protein